MTGRDAQAQRAAAARRWQPEQVRLLLVDEAPPSAPDRYFYFEDVATHDSLFRFVAAGVTGTRPDRDKRAALAALRDAGVFLLDACPGAFQHSRAALAGCLPDLVRRIDRLEPDHVLLVGAPLYDTAYQPLRGAGVPVLDARLPYPGSGQQRRFADEFAEVLAQLGLRPGP